MIENVNASKQPTGDFTPRDIYIGVASVNIKSVNPNNDTLRKWGWDISTDAPEPEYFTTTEVDGKLVKRGRIRLLAQIQDLPEKPIVALDFRIRPDVQINKEGTKCKVIDNFGRTAWATKAEIQSKAIPHYTNGPASISTPYKPCHYGEDELLKFIFKYDNVTPLQVWVNGGWTNSSNPGRISFDNWGTICEGNTREVVEMLSAMPENCVKVVLGVYTNPETNRSYQTFISQTYSGQKTSYLGNGSRPDMNTGTYPNAQKLIDDFFNGRGEDSPYSFSAAPVKKWTVSATKVEDHTENRFDSQEFFEDKDDLPFD